MNQHYTPTPELMTLLGFRGSGQSWSIGTGWNEHDLEIVNDEVMLRFIVGATDGNNHNCDIYFKCPDDAFFIALLKSLDWIQ